MSILVTGAAGFIGSSLANELNAKGHDVIALDNLFLGKKENLSEGVEFRKASVMNLAVLRNIFETSNIDYVFHFAALSSNPMFRPSPLDGMNVNIIGFSNIAEMCKDFNTKKLVYASTSSLYSGNHPPHKETDSVAPKIHYEKINKNKKGEVDKNRLSNLIYSITFLLIAVIITTFQVVTSLQDKKFKEEIKKPASNAQ